MFIKQVDARPFSCNWYWCYYYWCIFWDEAFPRVEMNSNDNMCHFIERRIGYIWVYRTRPIWLNTDLGKVLPTIIGNVAHFMNLLLTSWVMIFYRPKNKMKTLGNFGAMLPLNGTSPWLTLHFQPEHIRGGNSLWKNNTKFVVALPAKKKWGGDLVCRKKTFCDSFVET